MENMISVIIPVFNRAEPLIRAVSSVIEQEFRPIEIIIVDDGSTDNTQDTIRELCQEHPNIITSIRQLNRGAGIARQTGLGQAQGDFIQYLDSDDVVLPGKFSHQVKLLSDNPDCIVAIGLTYGINMRTSEGSSADGEHQHTGFLYPTILNYRWWTTSTPLYRSGLAHSARWGDITVLEDWDYEFQIAARGGKYCFTPEYVVEKSNDSDDQLSLYKHTERELWLESKARVMKHIVDQVLEMNLDRRNEGFSRFINKIIKTGEEALEYSRGDISKQMAYLAMRSMRHSISPNFLKRLIKLNLHSFFPGMKRF